MKRITVLLAEDHMVVRQGLRAILSAESDIEVIGEAANGRHAVEMTRKLHPDVVVMDIAMPLLNGLEATRQILKLFPAAKVLILSAHSDDEYIDRVIALGAVGYLIKQSSAEFLSKAIREAQKGNLVYSPTVSKRLQAHETKSSTRQGEFITNKASRLTSREVELVQLVAEGKANKQIAVELDISIKTVEKHRQALMQKLDIHDTAGLTRYAIAAGIIENSVQVTII
ncbi:MAG TPA: response regulator transcription factor [Planctomycetota bacterium]|nr:response regulator transcription factor [Planctomycetota bacterium]